MTIYSWVNQLFLWPFSIAKLNYQRVNEHTVAKRFSTLETAAGAADPGRRPGFWSMRR